MKILYLLSSVGRCNQSKLLKRCQRSLLASLVHNETVLQSENSNARKMNLLAGIGFLEGADG